MSHINDALDKLTPEPLVEETGHLNTGDGETGASTGAQGIDLMDIIVPEMLDSDSDVEFGEPLKTLDDVATKLTDAKTSSLSQAKKATAPPPFGKSVIVVSALHSQLKIQSLM
jgi:hypothetical protein